MIFRRVARSSPVRAHARADSLMTRRDISLTIALCASLVLHALLLGGIAEVYNVETGSTIFFPGFPKKETIAALLIPAEENREDPRQRLGDSQGHGDATSASPGDEPMRSPFKSAQAQPFLSLDPEGSGKIGEEPTDSVLPLGQPGSA